MTGIININKPKGFTSSDIVIIIKKIANQKRVGHLGTLDPMATGVLPVCLGKATRLFDFYLNKTKEYNAVFKFGMLTDTLDAEGNILEKNGKVPDKEAILSCLNSFLGEIEQIPPEYSAKNIGGVRAYQLARQGIEISLKPKKVNVLKFELIRQVDSESFEFLIECGSGTYIRSLCRDLAKSLDTVATMTSLSRIRCGEFKIENSIGIKQLTKENIKENYITLENALKNLPEVKLTEEEFLFLSTGRAIKCNENNGEVLIKYNGEVLGIGNASNGLLKNKIYLKE